MAGKSSTWRSVFELAVACLSLLIGTSTMWPQDSPLAPAEEIQALPGPSARSEAAEHEAGGDLATARDLYQQALRENPVDADSWHRLAVVSMRLGNSENALVYFGRATELAPENADLLNDHGFACFLSNDLQLAEQLLRHSLQVSPNNPKAATNLALVLGTSGRDVESRELFTRAGTAQSIEHNLAFVRALRRVRPPRDPVAPNDANGGETIHAISSVSGPAPPAPSDEETDTVAAQHDAVEAPRPVRRLSVTVARLRNSDPTVRGRALVEIAAMGPTAETALPAISKLLADPVPEVRLEAARAVWQVGRQADSATRALTELLDAPGSSMRIVAAFALGNIGEGAWGAVPRLRRMSAFGEGIERVHAAEAIARIQPGDSESIRHLSEALFHSAGEVRIAAVYALGLIAHDRDPRIYLALKAALQDNDSRIREAAALNLEIARATLRPVPAKVQQANPLPQ